MDKQQEAIKAITELKEELVIAGPAGSGKSWVVIQAVKELLKGDQTVMIAAPTYKALNRIRHEMGDHPSIAYKSVASLLGQIPQINTETGDLVFSGAPGGCAEDVVIVDEASMIDKSNLENLRALGAPLVLVGDPYQLPPVKHTDSPAFNCKNRIDLDQVHRQEKGPLLDFLSMCRTQIATGKKKKIDPERLGSGGEKVVKGYRPSMEWMDGLTRGSYDPDGYKILCYTNAAAAYHNSSIRELHRGSPTGFDIGEILINGNPIVRRVQGPKGWLDAILAPASTEFKVLKRPRSVIREGYTAYELEVGLSMPLYVIDPNEYLRLEQQLTALKKVAIRLKTKKAWRQFYALKNAFDDVRYTYALTIHRAQGSQFTEGFIDGLDLKKCREINPFNRLWYTAASRFKTRFIYSW